jgi:hypothetical protein
VYAHGHAAAPSTPFWAKLHDKLRQRIEMLAEKVKSNPLGLPTKQAEEDRANHEHLLKVTSNEAESSLTLSKSEIFLTGLLAEMARDRRRLDDAPIVFLNTCESAQVWNGVKGSFIGFFLSRGARAVIGSESTIPVVLADVFGGEVLKEIFAGRSVGEALLSARLSLLKEHLNPLGLCYCIYGAADAHVVPPPNKQS